MKPKGKVRRTWTPGLAYAIGLLATDGCLSNDGRHIDFTSKELDQVVTFKQCLGLRNKIGQKKGGYTGGLCLRVQFGDILFYQWLLEIGLMPNKSKIMGPLRIPDQYFFDFLRGNFDGDGCINAYWDPRWRNSYMYYIRFSSASWDYLQWLKSTVFRLCGIRGRISRLSKGYELVFAKKATRILIERMFYADDVPHLKRKLRRAEEIFRVDGRQD